MSARRVAEALSGFWRWDVTTNRVTWSAGLAAVFGLAADQTPQTLEGYLARVHPDDRARVQERVAHTWRTGEPFQHRERVLRGDGQERLILSTGEPEYDAHGALTALCGVCMDITDLDRLEAQSVQLQRLESVRRLSQSVAHEFNNLLTVVRGELSLLGEALPPENPASESLEVIAEAVERARDVTDKLLTFAQRHGLRPEPLDLRELICDLKPLLERLVGERVQLRLELPYGGWPVHIDRAQIEQVILDLVANACDAMPLGGALTLSLAWERLPHEARRGASLLAPGDYACLELRDQGEGLSPEVMARAMEPFFTTRQQRGLGLSTAHGVLASHRGALALESPPGQGAIARVYLPQARQITPMEEPTPPEGVLAPLLGAVLIVAPEPAMRGFIARVLAQSGLPVWEARDPQEALSTLHERAQEVGLVITDLLPDPEAQLIAQLQHRWPALRLLTVSAHGRLRKPFLPEQLMDAVEDAWRGPLALH
jgi:two-component system cell cycle sensor histidine kinase/response regulator CckA